MLFTIKSLNVDILKFSAIVMGRVCVIYLWNGDKVQCVGVGSHKILSQRANYQMALTRYANVIVKLWQ